MDLDHALATSPRYDLQTWQAMDQDVAYALHLQELEYSEDPTPTHPYFATATKSDFGGRSTMSDAALAKQIQAIEYEQVSDQRASSSPPQLTGSSSENIPMPSFLRRAASPVSNINGAVTNLIRVMGRRGRAAATTRGRHRSGVNLQENPDDFGPDAYEVGYRHRSIERTPSYFHFRLCLSWITPMKVLVLRNIRSTRFLRTDIAVRQQRAKETLNAPSAWRHFN